MVLRPLTQQLQNKAEKELNEIPSRNEEDLEHLREWLKKQPHFNARMDDQWLISFLRGCKFSLQRAKEKLDYFYTMRTLLPEYFADRDPFSSDIQEILQAGALIPLPNSSNKETGSPRIFLFRFDVCDPYRMPFTNLIKVFFMIMDIIMNEDDNSVVSGVIVWLDYKEFNLNYMLQYTPSFLKKSLMCLQNAYPLRVKSMHGTNAPIVIEGIFNLAKTFLSHKLKERLFVYSVDMFEKVYSHIPKTILPKEFGGDNESLDELAAQWRKKVESYREWYMDDAKYFSNEKLRIGLPKTTADLFGVEGTFRKLTID